jgi:Ca2+-binding EF-hand superfamily protein
MKRIPLVLASAAFVGATAGVAVAQAEMDTDGDGMFSFNEMLAAFPTLTEETFISIDANADGTVDEAELLAAQESGLVPATEG